jgi:hypothetical protein
MIEDRRSSIFHLLGVFGMALEYDEEYEEPAYRPRRGPLKSSGLGIASFIISILAGLEILTMIIIGIIMEMRKPGWADEESLQVMLFGLLIIGGFVVSLVGLVLGITGLVQGGRSKVFPVLGLGLNAVSSWASLASLSSAY